LSALTKILIVLQLVFAVAVSVLLVLMVSHQEDYRNSANTYRLQSLANAALLQQKEGEIDSAKGEARAARAEADSARTDSAKVRQETALKTSNLTSENLKAAGDITAKETQIASLAAALDTATKSGAAKDKELEALRPQVSKGTSENAELSRRNNELENQLRAAQSAIKALQEQLIVKNQTGGGPALNGAGGQVSMLTANAAPGASAAVNAKISNVMSTSGRVLIEMPLGTRDGISQNTPLFVYRSNGYVADAVVQRVTADTAVAVITKTKEGQSVQAGDLVSTIAR
jgi:hypothetical protein